MIYNKKGLSELDSPFFMCQTFTFIHSFVIKLLLIYFSPSKLLIPSNYQVPPLKTPEHKSKRFSPPLKLSGTFTLIVTKGLGLFRTHYYFLAYSIKGPSSRYVRTVLRKQGQTFLQPFPFNTTPRNMHTFTSAFLEIGGPREVEEILC